MAIPQRLMLRPVDKALVHEMSALCDAIERELEAGETAEVLLQRWHARAGRRCEPYEFQTYWKAMSIETFVLDALNPEPSFDYDVAYSEALTVLEAVANGSLPESDTRYYLRWLEAQFPGSHMNDLIFWPDEWFGDASLFRDANGAFKPDAELSNEQILGYAMAKSGRQLPGAPNDVRLPFPIPAAK